MKLEDLKFQPPMILLAGDYGSGKTAFSLTVGSRGYIIDVDNGLRTGMTLKDKFSEARRQVEVKPCWEEKTERAVAWGKVKETLKTVVQLVRAGKFDYDVLILDCFTTLCDLCMRQMLQSSGILGKNPQIQHWGLMNMELMNVLWSLKSLDITVVMLAHTRNLETDSGMKACLAIPGKALPPLIPPFFDEVWRIQSRRASQGKFIRTLQTMSSPEFSAKTRFNVEDKTLVDDGLPEILKRMGFPLNKDKEDVNVVKDVEVVSENQVTLKKEK